MITSIQFVHSMEKECYLNYACYIMYQCELGGILFA